MSRRTHGLTQSGATSRAPAEIFLEGLQSRVYASLGITAEDCQQRERLGQQIVLPERLRQKSIELPATEFERYRTALFEGLARDEQAPRPTRYERPHQYSILRELKETIERAVVRLSFTLPVCPVIGTLPTGSLEPLMLRVPDSGDIVIVLDGNLLTYANLLAKAVAQALPFDAAHTDDLDFVSEGRWPQAADRSGVARRRFTELMIATIDGNPGAAPPYLPDARYERLAADLCDFMELFVLAREYAKVVGGDHERAGPARHVVCGQPMDVLAWSGDVNLKADCIGLTLLLAAADAEGASLAWAWWAADVLLASFGMIERAVWLRGAVAGRALPTPIPSGHDSRRRVLRDMLRNWDGGQHAVRFANSLQPVLDLLEGAAEFGREADADPALPVH
jgi:hypothetical protein